MTMHIREQDDYDRMPDPNDMTYTEAQICNNITNCGNEIDMIDGTVRLLVQQMLLHWGLVADQTKIDISIKVRDTEEAITWIDHDRHRVDFSHIADHVLGLNAAIVSNTNAPHWVQFVRGGTMGNKFSLEIVERNYDD
jgi:hypothetical protein